LIALYATSWKYDCLLSGEEPRWANLNSGGPREIKVPIVAIGETTEPIPITINWTENDMNLVYGGAKRVAIYGAVFYRGYSPMNLTMLDFSGSFLRSHWDSPFNP